jgi:hypothetical protein
MVLLRTREDGSGVITLTIGRGTRGLNAITRHCRDHTPACDKTGGRRLAEGSGARRRITKPRAGITERPRGITNVASRITKTVRRITKTLRRITERPPGITKAAAPVAAAAEFVMPRGAFVMRRVTPDVPAAVEVFR